METGVPNLLKNRRDDEGVPLMVVNLCADCITASEAQQSYLPEPVPSEP